MPNQPIWLTKAMQSYNFFVKRQSDKSFIAEKSVAAVDKTADHGQGIKAKAPAEAVLTQERLSRRCR